MSKSYRYNPKFNDFDVQADDANQVNYSATKKEIKSKKKNLRVLRNIKSSMNEDLNASNIGLLED